MIELMISLVLGLLVVGAAIGIFISNRQTFRATENLGRVQENARTAFELMTRDVREAGGNPCDFNLPVANVVTGAGGLWYTNWALPVQGFDNGALAGTLPGTDAIQLLSGGSGAATVTLHNATATQFALANASHGFSTGDVLMVCDPQQVSVFRATVAGVNIGHAAAAGNCSDSLGILPAVCGGSTPAHTHSPNAVITRLHATRWYVKANARGNSLYQNIAGNEEEVAEGVENMQITYLQPGVAGAVDSYVAASAVTSWTAVRAVRFVITLESQDSVGTDGNPLQRQLIHVVTLRNRNA